MSFEALVVTPPEARIEKGRLVGLAVVIALHIGLVAALVMGLGHQMVEVLEKPLVTKIIELPRQSSPPHSSPRPTPVLRPPPPRHIPPPKLAIKLAPPMPDAITRASPQKPVAATPRPVAPMVTRTAPVIDAAESCSEPRYPPIARRLEESGTVVLRFLIGVDGRVVSGQVVQSSGYPILDKAAQRALSLCRFEPGTVNGKPVQSWATLKYLWKLQD